MAAIEFMFSIVSDKDVLPLPFIKKRVFSLSKSINKLLFLTKFSPLIFLLILEVEKEVEVGGGGGGVVDRREENNSLICLSFDSLRMFSDTRDLLELIDCDAMFI